MVEKKYECDFCGKKSNMAIILRDVMITKKDGSNILLCSECLNNYANGDYDKIKFKRRKNAQQKEKDKPKTAKSKTKI